MVCMCCAYSADRGDRPDKPNIALLFTDGNSNDYRTNHPNITPNGCTIAYA